MPCCKESSSEIMFRTSANKLSPSAETKSKEGDTIQDIINLPRRRFEQKFRDSLDAL